MNLAPQFGHSDSKLNLWRSHLYKNHQTLVYCLVGFIVETTSKHLMYCCNLIGSAGIRIHGAIA
ncbi:hypothetical protein [uncultured Nostoc sp.]|uniref:hypothetical protein n=1 Tax=uncultured Nostoc sp. TaxID=340711 RepID=UPI0035C9BAA1